MNQTDLLKVLESVRAGKLSPTAAVERLKHLPFEALGFAKVDHPRSLRQGFAEVVFAKGKTPLQVAKIVFAMLQKKDSRHNILVTRADAKVFAAVKKTNGKTARAAKFHPLSDRKSTRLNSSHSQISYAVFCLKKKKSITNHTLTVTHSD